MNEVLSKKVRRRGEKWDEKRRRDEMNLKERKITEDMNGAQRRERRGEEE